MVSIERDQRPRRARLVELTAIQLTPAIIVNGHSGPGRRRRRRARDGAAVRQAAARHAGAHARLRARQPGDSPGPRESAFHAGVSSRGRVESREPEVDRRIANWFAASATRCHGSRTVLLHLSPEPHTIRLRGPWQLEPVERFVLQPDGRYRPVDRRLAAAGAGDDAGRLVRRLRRRFSGPRPLSPDVSEADRTRIGRAGVAGRRAAAVAGRVSLSDKLLGFVSSRATRRHASTSPIALEDHNRLEIIVDHPALDETRQPTTMTQPICHRRTGGRSAAGN